MTENRLAGEQGAGAPDNVVEEQVRQGNPWYVASQFAWASSPSVKPIYQRRRDYIVACIERARGRLGSDLRLLDAGCGDGYWLACLSGVDGLHLTGIDYNPLRVERAREAAPQARVLVGNLTGFASDVAFDIVLLNQVLEHVDDDVGLLQTARGLLRPSGMLILGTPNEGSWLQLRRIRRQRNRLETDHVHFYTEAAVRRKLLEAGFQIDSVMREVFYVGNDPLYYWLTRRSWGFALLELMTRLWPSGCSDVYFECRAP